MICVCTKAFISIQSFKQRSQQVTYTLRTLQNYTFVTFMHVFLCVLFCIFSICNDSKKFFERLLIFKNFPDFFISMLCTCQKRKNNFHVSNSFKLGEVHWFVIQCVFHCCRTFLFVKLLLKFSTNYFYSFVHCINKKKCR